jgi:hypothetical protein
MFGFCMSCHHWFLLRPLVFGQRTTFFCGEVLASSHIAEDSCCTIIHRNNRGEAGMRHRIIMPSAAGITALMVGALAATATAQEN